MHLAKWLNREPDRRMQRFCIARWAKPAALMNGTTLTKVFMSLPGGGVAVYTSSGLAYYRHADWLGSSRLASTQARGLYSIHCLCAVWRAVRHLWHG